MIKMSAHWRPAALFFIALGVALCFASLQCLKVDEFRLALMGRDLLRNCRIYEYFPGQHYMGSAEGIIAGLAEALVGPGWLAVRLIGIVCFAASALAACCFWKDGWRGLAGGLLLVAMPAFAVDVCIQLRGYSIPLLSGALLVLVCSRSLEPGFRAGGMVGLFSGFLAGAGFWCNPQSLMISVPAFALLARHWRNGWFLPGAFAGVIAGLFPAFLHWFKTGVFMRTIPAQWDALSQSLADIPRRLTMVWGVQEHPEIWVRLATSATVLALIATGLAACAWDHCRNRERRWFAVFWVSLAGGVALFALSGKLWASERYLASAYPAAVFLAANGWGGLLARIPALRYGFAILVLCSLTTQALYISTERKTPSGAFEAELLQAAEEVEKSQADALIGNERIAYGIAYYITRELPVVTWKNGPEAWSSFAHFESAFPAARRCSFSIVDDSRGAKASGPNLAMFTRYLKDSGYDFPLTRHGRIGIFNANCGGKEAVGIFKGYESYASAKR